MKYIIFLLLVSFSLKASSEENFLDYEDISPKVLEMIKDSATQTIDFMRGLGFGEFGYNEGSIRILSDLISEEGTLIPKERYQNISANWGAYLGQAIIKKYGGKWIKLGDGYAILVRESYVTFPISKVYKHLINGEEDAIYALYISVGHNIEKL